jgi:hypothetical protein
MVAVYCEGVDADELNARNDQPTGNENQALASHSMSPLSGPLIRGGIRI